MAKCKQCNKSGLFLKLKQGYCNECFEKVSYYQIMIPQWIRILDDCIRIMNETKDISIFFSRYDLSKERLSNLLESVEYISFNQHPNKVIQTLESRLPDAIDEMINRYKIAVELKMQSLKTTKAKENAISKFSDTIAKYEERLFPQNKEFVNKMIGELRLLIEK